jgi:hypothetical protein
VDFDISNLPPVTGTWPPDEEHRDLEKIPPHEGFDNAIQDAVDRAAAAWHKSGDDPIKVWALVELYARVDIYNPGGIGQYGAKLTPKPGPGG